MNYCGENVNYRNIPSDYRDQMDNILLDLESINMKHNDIDLEELLIKNGLLYLCDFWLGFYK